MRKRNGGSWVTNSVTKFLYDGWNLALELNGQSSDSVIARYSRQPMVRPATAALRGNRGRGRRFGAGTARAKLHEDWLVVRPMRTRNPLGAGLLRPPAALRFLDDALRHHLRRRALPDDQNCPARGRTTLTTDCWGLDLSESLQGAGGIRLRSGSYGGQVGGLLAVDKLSGTETSAFCGFDGNGNLGQLVDTSDGTLLARYEYDPYGREIRAAGTLADWNRIRFSTKYLDPETVLYCYGYRFYSPGLGRWVSRDPLGEEGALALLLFVGNSPVGSMDPLGTKPFRPSVPKITPTMLLECGVQSLFENFWNFLKPFADFGASAANCQRIENECGDVTHRGCTETVNHDIGHTQVAESFVRCLLSKLTPVSGPDSNTSKKPNADMSIHATLCWRCPNELEDKYGCPLLWETYRIVSGTVYTKTGESVPIYYWEPMATGDCSGSPKTKDACCDDGK